MMVLGPGAAGETALAADLPGAAGPGVDVFSYHHYGPLSERCVGTSALEAALSEQWRADGSGAHLPSKASKPIRARQADLAH
jgi:hypothetical protein